MKTKSHIPCELRPEQITAIVDSREQLPLDLAPLRTTVAGLNIGDYSVKHLESVVAVERKSLSDLLMCVGTDRPRFQRQVDRLLGVPCRLLVVESSWAELQAGQWRSQIKPAAVIGSLLSWMGQGLPMLLAGDHEEAGRFVSRFLFLSARRRYRENRALVAEAAKPKPKKSPNAVDPATVDAMYVV